MYFLACLIHCKMHWARAIQIDFSAAFDWVNHQGILNKHCSVGIGGALLIILTPFLSKRLQHVMVNGCQSKLANVVRSPAGQCFGTFVLPVHLTAVVHSEE